MLEELSEGLHNHKNFLNELSQRSERFNDAMVEALQKSIVNSLQSWLETHPIASWLINHPLWLLCSFIVLLLLFGGLLRVIGRLTEETWLIIFQSPFRLARWLINIAYKALTNASTSEVTNLKVGKNDKKEQLTYILLRLEEIKQEQEELLKKMKTILNSTKI